jgi:hypothetical protein
MGISQAALSRLMSRHWVDGWRFAPFSKRIRRKFLSNSVVSNPEIRPHRLS